MYFTHWNGLWLIIAFIFFEQLEHRACGMKVEMEMEMEARIIGRAPKPWFEGADGCEIWERRLRRKCGLVVFVVGVVYKVI